MRFFNISVALQIVLFGPNNLHGLGQTCIHLNNKFGLYRNHFCNADYFGGSLLGIG